MPCCRSAPPCLPAPRQTARGCAAVFQEQGSRGRVVAGASRWARRHPGLPLAFCAGLLGGGTHHTMLCTLCLPAQPPPMLPTELALPRMRTSSRQSFVKYQMTPISREQVITSPAFAFGQAAGVRRACLAWQTEPSTSAGRPGGPPSPVSASPFPPASRSHRPPLPMERTGQALGALPLVCCPGVTAVGMHACTHRCPGAQGCRLGHRAVQCDARCRSERR